MEDREFNAKAEELVRRLLPRVPQKYTRGFERAIAGGEFSIAIENLVYTLANDRVAVDEIELDLLKRLVREIPSDPELTSKLGALMVERPLEG